MRSNGSMKNADISLPARTGEAGKYKKTKTEQDQNLNNNLKIKSPHIVQIQVLKTIGLMGNRIGKEHLKLRNFVTKCSLNRSIKEKEKKQKQFTGVCTQYHRKILLLSTLELNALFFEKQVLEDIYF